LETRHEHADLKRGGKRGDKKGAVLCFSVAMFA